MSSSQLPFPDLSIQEFRGFQRLAIPNLGRVTLITGKNNTGKSSILEAVWLHTQNAALQVIHAILTARGEYLSSREDDAPILDPARDFPVSPLFYGFPSFDDDFGPIVVETRNTRLSLEAAWLVTKEDPEDAERLISRREAAMEESPGQPVLVARTETRPYVMPLDALSLLPRRLARSDRARMRCKVVKSLVESESLGRLWDEATLRGEEDEVVRAWQIIDPDITALRMIGGEPSGSERMPFVGTGRTKRPVPLRAFGDGLNRLLALMLALLDARSGLLLIDEFENGLHHTVQLEAWRTIFQLAQKYNIQVFATTHSWDTVATFQKAAAETPEAGVLLRLIRRGDDIIPTIFAEEELAVATRSRIEVR